MSAALFDEALKYLDEGIDEGIDHILNTDGEYDREDQREQIAGWLREFMNRDSDF